MPLPDPLVHPRFHRVLDLFRVPPHRHIEMEVLIAHVAVAYHAHDRVLGRVFSHQPGGSQAFPRLLDEGVQLLDRDGEIVLVRAAVVADGFRDALAPRPQALGLRLVLRQDPVRDDRLAHDVLQERLDLVVVVLCVGARGLDQTVERVSALQRSLVLRDRVDEILALPVHELERREDLAELDLGLFEGPLDVLEGGQAKVRDDARLRPWRTLYRHAGDDADRTFAAHEELLDVIARVVLA